MFNPQGLQDALDTMRENTETKQGPTVDKASTSSQVKPGSQRIQLQKVQKP